MAKHCRRDAWSGWPAYHLLADGACRLISISAWFCIYRSTGERHHNVFYRQHAWKGLGWTRPYTGRSVVILDRGPDEQGRGKWREVRPGFDGYDPSYDPAPPTPEAMAREVESWGPVPEEPRSWRGREEPSYSFGPPPAYYQAPPPPYAYPYGYPYPSKPANPALATTGGMLTLVAGALTLLWVALTAAWGDFVFFFPFDTCLIVQVIFGIVAVIGGLAAIMKRFFPLAVMGAVLAMVSGGFFGLSFLLGLIGLIFIAISHSAFAPMGNPLPVYRY